MNKTGEDEKMKMLIMDGKKHTLLDNEREKKKRGKQGMMMTTMKMMKIEMNIKNS